MPSHFQNLLPLEWFGSPFDPNQFFCIPNIICLAYFWIGRIGKILQFFSGFTILLDFLGEDRLRLIQDQVLSKLKSKNAVSTTSTLLLVLGLLMILGCLLLSDDTEEIEPPTPLGGSGQPPEFSSMVLGIVYTFFITLLIQRFKDRDKDLDDVLYLFGFVLLLITVQPFLGQASFYWSYFAVGLLIGAVLLLLVSGRIYLIIDFIVKSLIFSPLLCFLQKVSLEKQLLGVALLFYCIGFFLDLFFSS